MTRTVEILRGAKTVLERNGWHQGTFYDQAQHDTGVPRAQCRVCLMGAVYVAASGSPITYGYGAAEAQGLLTETLDRRGRWEQVYDWNDAPGRTLAEVLELLDATIEDAEQRSGGVS